MFRGGARIPRGCSAPRRPLTFVALKDLTVGVALGLWGGVRDVTYDLMPERQAPYR